VISLRLGGFGRRAFSIVPSLLGLLVLTFVLGRIMPADPVSTLVGDEANADAIKAVRERLGLDLPLWQQFMIYLGHLARGDLGNALLTGNPVAKDLLNVFPATIELATLAIAVSILVGVPLGLGAALYRDGIVDYVARGVALLGYSVPIFWFGMVGLLIFYASLGWVGGSGRVEVFYEDVVPRVTGLLLIDSLVAGEHDVFWSAVRHGVLPASVLAYSSMAYITRMTRSFALEQLGQDYIIAARAKGCSRLGMVVRHLVPNIGVQLVTILALSYGSLLEGAVLVETVFAWPGLGQYLTSALLIGDINAILGCTLLIGLVFTLLNLLADLAYVALDPRTRDAA
jgi:peptide/nickel transport system permease protein